MNFENSYITPNTIEKFSKKLGYNLVTHLDLYSYFIQNYQHKITKYFTEPDTEPDADSFDFLAKLLKECEKIDNLIKINKKRFSNIGDWDLLDMVENIRISLQTIDNTSRYTRSSKSKNSWNSTSISSEYMLGQHQNLENVSMQELGSTDPQNDWAQLAIKNNISEIDYNDNGGLFLDIEKHNQYSKNLSLKSVIDNLVGEKIYGADFDKKLQFVDDDLKVLSNKETFIQSIGILVMLRKGDVPEFVDFGVDPRLGTGSNINVFEYGLITRQFQETMASDDTIIDFRIIGFQFSQDSAFFTYEVDSFYNLIIKDSKKL